MTKYALLFIGGLVPDEKREQNEKDWNEWLKGLEDKGNLIEGAPFGPKSKVISSQDRVTDYNWEKDSNVGGYCIVKASTINEAVELCKDCPQLFEKYGSGTIEVREILAMQQP